MSQQATISNTRQLPYLLRAHQFIWKTRQDALLIMWSLCGVGILMAAFSEDPDADKRIYLSMMVVIEVVYFATLFGGTSSGKENVTIYRTGIGSHFAIISLCVISFAAFG